MHQRSAGSIIAVEPCKLLKISGADSVKAFKRSLELSALEVLEQIMCHLLRDITQHGDRIELWID